MRDEPRKAGFFRRLLDRLLGLPRWIQAVCGFFVATLLLSGICAPIAKDAIVDRLYRGGIVAVANHCDGPEGTIVQLHNQSNQDKYITRALFQVERVDNPSVHPCTSSVPEIVLKFAPSSNETESDYHQKTKAFYAKTLEHKIDKFSRQNVIIKIKHAERAGWNYVGTMTIWFDDDAGQRGSLTESGVSAVVVGDD